jgi:hypothetical protein
LSTIAAEPGKRPHAVLHAPKLHPIVASRLLDHELERIAPRLQPLERDYNLELRRALARERCVLPKVFVAAERLFGRTSGRFDPYKCSFRFPLLITEAPGKAPLRYVALLEDVRGSVLLPFSRLERQVVSDRGYQKPIDDELSRDDLNYLTDYLLGYLDGFAESTAVSAPAFYRVIQSEYTVYGYREGDWFEDSYENEKQLEDRLGQIRSDLGQLQHERDGTWVEGLLEDAARGRIRF